MPTGRALLFRLATSDRFERVVRASSTAESRAWRAASRYVAGVDLADACAVAQDLDRRGIRCSVDRFGESTTDPVVVGAVADGYVDLAGALDRFPSGTWLSVDLSHLGVDVDERRCAAHLRRIVEALPAGCRLQVGAEEAGRADAILGCVGAIARAGLADRIGATLQANLRRSPDDLDRMIDAGVHVRLVKGAYVEPSSRALPYGEATDLAYLRLADRLAASATPFALATHDGVLREATMLAHGPVPVEQLLGVRTEQLAALVARAVPVRVYVPFGDDWFRYWMRRVAESRGA